jgi:hypothetical protein
LVAAALVVVGCGSAGDDSSAFIATLEHTFDPIRVESGTEEYWCQSWALNNDETLYVNKVRQVNDGAWHHSNWSFVPEDTYGEDGTWKCRDRDWNQVTAAALGGVIFAQSTQAFDEVQAFPEGAVIVVPPRSQIVGTVHLFNAGAARIDTSLTMGLQALEEEEVEVKLREVSFLMGDIAIPARERSLWSQTCDIGDMVGESYNIYYVLGHYHQWGNSFQMSFVDDDGNERSIVDFTNNPGDTLGVTINPPLNSEGAGRLKYVCGYNNTTDYVLRWGNSGDVEGSNGEAEMCQFLAYIDGDTKIAAFEGNLVQDPEPIGETDDGVLLYDLPCGTPFGLPGRN